MIYPIITIMSGCGYCRCWRLFLWVTGVLHPRAWGGEVTQVCAAGEQVITHHTSLVLASRHTILASRHTNLASRHTSNIKGVLWIYYIVEERGGYVLLYGVLTNRELIVQHCYNLFYRVYLVTTTLVLLGLRERASRLRGYRTGTSRSAGYT